MGRRVSAATGFLASALLLSAALTSANGAESEQGNKISPLTSARALMHQAHYDQALDLLNAAGVRDSSNLDVQLTRIYCIMMLGRYKEAEDACSTILRKDARVWRARLMRLEAENKLKQFDRAYEDKELLSEFNSNPYLYAPDVKAARGYIKQENYAKGIEYYSKYLKRDPKDPLVCYERGKAYRAVKQYDKSLQDLTTCIRYGPTRSKVFFERALTLIDLKRFKEAIMDLGRFIDLHPAYDAGFYQRAEIYRKIGQNKDAVVDYTSVLCFQPEDEEALRLRAETYMAMGEYDRAAADLTRALELGPMEPGWHYLERAKAYDKLGKHNLAEADRKKAKELRAKVVNE